MPNDIAWINVKDRLPEESTESNKNTDWVLCHFRWGTIASAMFLTLRGVWTTGHTTFVQADVTHWMTLPEPPEVENE